MRLFRKTLVQRALTQGTDEVIGHTPIPSESSLNNVWCECHLIAAADVNVHEIVLYGVDGRVIPDDDPGDATLLDLEWDLNISKDKDVAAGAFSMDPGSSESGPMFEPGEPSLEKIMNMGLVPLDQDFYKRRKMLSFMNIPRAFKDATPDTYLPGDIFKFHSSKRIGVEVMSNALLVLSTPSMDDVTTTAPTSFSTESKWMQMKYFEFVLEQSWVELMGLTESGAESPWEDAALLVEELLEPTVVEETVGSIQETGWDAFCWMTWDVTVPGRREFKTISVS